MKKLVTVLGLSFVFLIACTTQKPVTSVYNDDVYANPKEDRLEETRIAEANKKINDANNKRYNDSLARVKQIQKEKDDANPYYKDREFKYDDYYDYEYATRVKRFNNQINGLSYYDNYYTNSYWYNQNALNYGVSVYNGYSWWGSSYNNYSYNPSVNFYSNLGWGCSNGYGFNGYNPYLSAYTQGYNNGFNNGYFGNYYGYGSPYAYGNSFGYNSYYGNPYGYNGYGLNNPYNTSWGYYNSYDLNSSYTYGPRSSHGGGNSRRVSNPGITGKRDSYYEQYIDETTEKQKRAVKFDDIATLANENGPKRVVREVVPAGTGGIKHPNSSSNPINNNEPTRQPIRTINSDEPIKSPVLTAPVKAPVKIESPTRAPIKNQAPIKPNTEAPVRNEPQIRQYQEFQAPKVPNENGGNNTPSSNGGGRRPR